MLLMLLLLLDGGTRHKCGCRYIQGLIDQLLWFRAVIVCFDIMRQCEFRKVSILSYTSSDVMDLYGVCNAYC